VPVINLESEFPKIYDFMEYIRDSVKSRATLKALVNIVGNEFSGNKHHDPYHVFSVQHIGTVEYNIFDSEDNKITYTLEPGDLIFMPSGTTHSISAPTSRGTLILDIE
jgi:mannose-6-phosphate isomerase-like protein (cupin superfamily)